MLEQWTKSPATSDLTQLTQQITELKQLIQTGITAVKSIQRGVTTEATTITIDAVDMEKSFLYSMSKSGNTTVYAKGNISLSGYMTESGYKVGMPSTTGVGMAANVASGNYRPGSDASYPATIYENGSLTSSNTSPIVTKAYSARLISDNQIQCDGAVEWQLIEFN